MLPVLPSQPGVIWGVFESCPSNETRVERREGCTSGSSGAVVHRLPQPSAPPSRALWLEFQVKCHLSCWEQIGSARAVPPDCSANICSGKCLAEGSSSCCSQGEPFGCAQKRERPDLFCSPTRRECLVWFLTISVSVGAVPSQPGFRRGQIPARATGMDPKPSPGCSGNKNAEKNVSASSRKPHGCFLGEGLLESAAPAFLQLPSSSLKPSNVWINPSFLPSMDGWILPASLPAKAEILERSVLPRGRQPAPLHPSQALWGQHDGMHSVALWKFGSHLQREAPEPVTAPSGSCLGDLRWFSPFLTGLGMCGCGDGVPPPLLPC